MRNTAGQRHRKFGKGTTRRKFILERSEQVLEFTIAMATTLSLKTVMTLLSWHVIFGQKTHVRPKPLALMNALARDEARH